MIAAGKEHPTVKWVYEKVHYEHPEEREGLNLAICDHGWPHKICGICNPVSPKKKENVTRK